MTGTGRRAGLLLLHRALRNAGDSLIFERARRLITDVLPGTPLDVAEAWHRLDEQMPPGELRRYRAVVVCGGPGYVRGIHDLYPIGALEELPPLVLLALGSRVNPGTRRQLTSFRFDADDRRFLDEILSRSNSLGARDPLTAELLRANGYQRVTMTGDPAWYALDRIDQPARTPSAFAAIAFTPPANPAYYHQATLLFKALAAAEPRARGHVVFHRGVQPPFAEMAERLGWKPVDITGSAGGFRIYDEMDLHVGYRLHAHLYCTSVGTTSYVVAEDSRGIGMLQAFPGLGVPAFPSERGLPWLSLGMRAMPKLAATLPSAVSRAASPLGRLLGLPNVEGPLIATIEADRTNHFPAHSHARDVIRATLPVMRETIAAIP